MYITQNWYCEFIFTYMYSIYKFKIWMYLNKYTDTHFNSINKHKATHTVCIDHNIYLHIHRPTKCDSLFTEWGLLVCIVLLCWPTVTHTVSNLLYQSLSYVWLANANHGSPLSMSAMCLLNNSHTAFCSFQVTEQYQLLSWSQLACWL